MALIVLKHFRNLTPKSSREAVCGEHHSMLLSFLSLHCALQRAPWPASCSSGNPVQVLPTTWRACPLHLNKQVRVTTTKSSLALLEVPRQGHLYSYFLFSSSVDPQSVFSVLLSLQYGKHIGGGGDKHCTCSLGKTSFKSVSGTSGSCPLSLLGMLSVVCLQIRKL